MSERTSARTSTTTHALSTWSHPLTELHSPCLFHVKRAAVSMKRTVAARAPVTTVLHSS